MRYLLEAPQSSLDIAFGFRPGGRGKVWGADFKLGKAGATVAVTSREAILPRKPRNMDFEK